MSEKLQNKYRTSAIFQLLCCSAIMLVSNTVVARSLAHGYFGAHASYNWLESKNVHTTLPPTTTSLYAPFTMDDESFGGGISMGTTIMPECSSINIRPELELGHFGTAKEQAPLFGGLGAVRTEIKTYALMFNLYLEAPVYEELTNLYIGGGLGLDRKKTSNEIDTINGDDGKRISKTDFAWSVMLGGNQRVSSRIRLDAFYRYMDFGNVKLGTIDAPGFGAGTTAKTKSSKLTSHSVNLGILIDI